MKRFQEFWHKKMVQRKSEKYTNVTFTLGMYKSQEEHYIYTPQDMREFLIWAIAISAINYQC